MAQSQQQIGGTDSPSTADLAGASSSSSSEPYPYAYHYTNNILTNIEFSDGSYQSPYAYHYDNLTSRYLFAEFNDGSVLQGTLETSDSDLDYDDDFPAPLFNNYDDDFPALQAIIGENIEDNEGATRTFQAETEERKTEPKSTAEGDKKGVEVPEEQGSGVSSSGSAILCMDRLREELSCAICLEICFEPCTTPCGHSFCKNCLTSAADKCGKRCPKCRQQLLIRNRRGTSISTVLWNSIQLLFPKEVEARKAAGELSRAEAEHPQRMNSPSGVQDTSLRTWRELSSSSSEDEDSGEAEHQGGPRMISQSEEVQDDIAQIIASWPPWMPSDGDGNWRSGNWDEVSVSGNWDGDWESGNWLD